MRIGLWKMLLILLVTLTLFGAARAQTVKGTAIISGGEALLPICVGHTCHDVWGVSSLSLTANGSAVGALSGQGSTPASMANRLCSQMTSSFPVQCTGVTDLGNSATMALQANSNFQISTSCRIQSPTNISGCLFSASLTGAFDPAYQILSIIYAPPGDHSSNGFANATSTGTTTTVGSNFAQGTSISLSATGGLIGQGSFGVTFGVSAATGNSQAFSVTYQSGTGSQLLSTEQSVDHSQDQFFLWLNPEMSFTSGTSSSTTYSVGTVGNQQMDIVNVNAAGLQNPSLIPLGTLRSQPILPGVVLPGLSKICAHPLPDDQCTVSNACGCLPSDFAAILATDPLIGTSQLTQPSQIDSSRFVFVNSQILEGPAQAGGDPVLNSFTENDSTLQSLTESESLSNSTSYSTSSGVNIPFLFTLNLTNTSSFTSTITESQGTQSGSSHQASITLGSDKVACFEHVDIYEDTAFHTFAFALPATPPAECQ
jgi:hypothetical protein